MKEKETNNALKETTEYFNGDDLAASVFISKYAKKDETTPDDMHRRMAREYARIEKQFGGENPLTEEEIYEQFKDFKYIIPAGSVMSGLGNEEYQGSLSNCFKEGTKVHTVNKGVVNIESVEIGDVVISQDGNRHKVSQLHKTPVSDKIIYDLKCFRTPKITCTDNHKFLSISKEQINWGESVKENPISYLRVGDYIAIPNNYTESDDITIDVLDYISNNEIYGGSTYTLDKYDNEFVYFKSSHKQLDPIKRYWHIDDDFCYFMGLWYGDGCVFSDRTDRVRVNKLNTSRKESKSIIHGITFTFGTHEKKLIEFTKTYGDRLFGKEGKIQQSNNDKSTQVLYHSGIVGIVFEKLFGSFSYGKKLWNGFQELSNNHVISLLCGLIDSDGTITKAGDIRVVLINDSLVNSFYHLARTRGLLVGKSSSLIKSSFDKEKEIETSRLDFDRTFIKYIKNNKFYSDSRILEAKEKSNKYSPEFYIERDGYTLVRISDKIKNTENIEYVYNIGVDDVHSYNVEGVVCMNCFVIGSPADSYASIMRYREFQVQLMKRRGGCIEENTSVITQERGAIPIKDVNVGEHVLSLNVETGLDEFKLVKDKYPASVDLNEQIELVYKNGVKLKTSSKHPVLTIEPDGYKYKKEIDGGLINSWNKSPNFKKYEETESEYSDIAWFIGCHMGDGTCDLKNHSYRLRIVGDNKSVIEKYKKVHNEIILREVGSVSLEKRYNSDVWGFNNMCKENELIVNKYFDQQINKKTYTWKVPTFVIVNNLWIPFLAGLIDSDGYITKTGRIDISITSKNAIDCISKFLSINGQSYSIKEKITKRPNEKNIFDLHIHKENGIYSDILKYISHDKKRERMLAVSDKFQSDCFFFNDDELKQILEINYREFTEQKKFYNLFVKNKQNLKDNKVGGKALLMHLLNNNLIEEKLYNSICSRTQIKEILVDNGVKYNYIDIEVEGNNNYYAGEFGFVNIHNCGVDISDLRPSGAIVKNAAKTSTGPVSFMEVNSELTKEVAQGGRRGALLISISCLHPDSDQFIEKKQDLSKVTGANISVQFTDEFMECVLEDKLYLQRFPINTDVTDIDITTLPLNEKVWVGKKCFKLIKATDLWKQFAHCSWKTAEPGVMFCDKHWDLSPDSVYKEYKGVTTNPCGEIFMGPYDSCRLMHINLASLIDNPYTTEASINRKKLYETSYNNMVLCDDLVELELEHVQEIIEHIKSTYTDDCYNELELWNRIYKTGKSSRRAGCGATGLGDAIAMLGFGLGDESGREAESVMFRTKFIAELQAQVDLAKERGTFVGYDFNKEFVKIGDSYKGKNRFFNFIVELYEAGYVPKQLMLDMEKYGRRNVSWSTLAPVGSASLLTQTTSGLEPLFSPFYKRRKKISKPTDRVDFIDDNGEKFSEFFVVHKPLKDWIIGFGSNYDKTKDFSEQATDENLDIWFKESPWYGSSAEELTPEEHILSQAIAQKYTTHSISKTINLPETATEEEVSKLFIDGWKNDCKGLTIYRANCRQGILVKTDKKESNCNGTLVHSAPKRPKTLTTDVKRFKNGGDKWIACVGLMNGQPYEIFTGLSEKLNIPDYVKEAEIIKSKIDKEVLNDETGLMEIQKVSRYDIRYINDKSEKVTVENLGQVFNPIFYNYNKLISGLFRHGMPIEYAVSTIKSLNFDNESINSWKNGVVRILKSYLKDGEVKGEVCPECGAKIVRENGCKRCGANCGWSACS